MKKLKIDLGDLMEAFDTASEEMVYYLDTETGEIILLSNDIDGENSIQIKRWREAIEADQIGRYARVPALTTPEGYREMMHFIELAESQELRAALKAATSGRGAFRRFKDVLVRYPEERQAWFVFKDERLRERAEEWLAGLRIQVEEEQSER